MRPLKYLAHKRGIDEVSLNGVVLPVDMAFDNDAFAPIMVISSAITIIQAGLFDVSTPFPWQVEQAPENEGADAIIEGVKISQHDSPIPESVMLLFMDLNLERAVQEQMQEQNLSAAPSCLKLDSLFVRIEEAESLGYDIKWSERVPFEPAY